MFDKITTFNILPKDGFEVVDNELVKTASAALPDGVQYDPDYLYMWVRAVSAGEYWGPNKNMDFFEEQELLNSYKTFLSAHAFKNHENKAIEGAIGDVLIAKWNDRMKGVELFIRIDRRIAPSIVRGFEKGFMTDVSMGCKVDYSICSICHNKARTRKEYCDHILRMKGQTFDDGRKVYEINKGPKFHDISAVLKGAERVAKNIGLYVHNGQVAVMRGDKDNKVEKVAFDLSNSFEETENNNVLTKVAALEEQKDILASQIFDVNSGNIEKLSSEKIAEIKEELNAKVKNAAVKNAFKDKLDDKDNFMQLIKLLYTKYWDKDKCSTIAKKIKQIASKNKISISLAFDQFINTCNFAGIELSPLELHDIFVSLTGGKSADIRSIVKSDGANENTIKSLVGLKDKSFSRSNDGLEEMPISKLVKRMALMHGHPTIRAKIISHTPIGGINRALSALSIGSDEAIGNSNILDGVQNDFLSNILKGELEDRSSFNPFIMGRMSRIINNEVEPNFADCFANYSPLQFINKDENSSVNNANLGLILASLLHSVYEKQRVASANSPVVMIGMRKIAQYSEGASLDDAFTDYGLEKEAGKVKMALTALPLTYSYSALQRSRIHNGENVSSMNRYVAENPGNAALAGMLLTGIAHKNISKGIEASKPLANKAKDLVKNKLIPKLKKSAEENVDIFNNKSVDSLLKSAGYNDSQIGALKVATVLLSNGQEDSSSMILNKYSLSNEDTEQYLKLATDYTTIEIEKQAQNSFNEFIKSVGTGVATHDIKKASTAAFLPGMILDGVVLSKLSNPDNKIKQSN